MTNNCLNKEVNITAIICGAGKGNRSGLTENKIFAVMPNGKCVLENAVYPFDKCERVNQIVITASSEDFLKVQNIAKNFETPTTVVLGGSTRTQSVQNAISASLGDCVLIHDGARPFVDGDIVYSCIETVKRRGSAVTVASLVDTVAETDDHGRIIQFFHPVFA